MKNRIPRSNNLSTIFFAALSLSRKIIVAYALCLNTVLADPLTDKQLREVSKHLKPIDDSKWSTITSTQSADHYEVQKGDTLWTVSQRIFGNAFYWPKVWSINNINLHNPHIVSPGQKLVFTNSLTTMPQVALNNDTSVTKSDTAENQSSSGEKEYEKIPSDWWVPPIYEYQYIKKYNEYGFDTEIRQPIVKRFAFRVPVIANESQITELGTITASRREGTGIAQHDVVFLKSNFQDLQVGSSYSILSDAEFVRDERATRSGFLYQTIGEVKILAIKDDLYIGSVTKAYDVIKRGAKVYPLLPKVSDIIPTAATKAIEGLIVTSTTRTTKSHAQYQFIHLDRGFEDGVQIGNVFRVYEYNDPTTKEPITKSDFLIKADALVIHATAQFSTAMILRSIKSVERSDFGITLTDVSELERLSKDRSRQFGNGGPTQGDPIDEELDELDALDRSSGEGIGNNERKEIEQLDQWDKARGDSGSAPSNSGQPSEPTPQSNPTVEQFIVPDNNASTADDAALDKDLTPTPPASNVVPDLTPAPPNTDGGNAYNPTTISTPNAPAPDLAPIEAPPPLPEPDPVTPTTTPAPAADSTTPSTVEMSEPAPVSEE